MAVAGRELQQISRLPATKALPWANALRMALLREDRDGIPRINKIAEATVKAAMRGESWAIREIGDRMDGRVNLQLEDKGENDRTSLQDGLITALVAALTDKKLKPGDDAKVIEQQSVDATDVIAQAVERKRKQE